MKRAFASNVALLLAIGASSLFLKASTVLVPSGTWAPTGDLTETRAGAAAVLLSDGVVLITGGSGPDGRTASAERYSATSGTFIATTSMGTARANHTATVVERWTRARGRRTWCGWRGHGRGRNLRSRHECLGARRNAGSRARWTHRDDAARWQSARSGRRKQEGALASMEVYSPVFEEFLLVAAPMTAARTRHAAALAGDKVLIMGGWDGAAALASVDVYDPATDAVAAGPEMLGARAEHTATTLLSGNVLVAGGMNAAGRAADRRSVRCRCGRIRRDSECDEHRATESHRHPSSPQQQRSHRRRLVGAEPSRRPPSCTAHGRTEEFLFRPDHRMRRATGARAAR